MACMPYLAEFLSEKFLKETSFFEPLRGISVSKSAAHFVESNPNNLGELVGGALVLADGRQTKADLLPPSLVGKRELSKRLPLLITAATMLLLTLGAWYGYALNAASTTRAQTEKINASIGDESHLASQIDALSSKLAITQKSATDLLSIIAFRDVYPSIIADLNARIPRRFLWITEIQPVSDLPSNASPVRYGVAPPPLIKAISVKGLYLDNPREAGVIDDFVTALQSSDIFSVEEKEKSKIITQRGSPNGQLWAYPFSLVIPLRTPLAPLP
jgi:hypothetical protein